MHSYRWDNFREPVADGADNAGWYEMLGLQSTGHGPQAPIEVSYATESHAITNGLENWTTINEELYNNVRVFSGAQVIASGKQVAPPKKGDLKKDPNAKPTEATAVVAWTNEFGPNKTKIFNTTLGHNNDTVGDARYLDLVTRGLLWATGNLTSAGKATAAYAK
jgi:type 1 glutamine amidotransferase